MHCFELKEDVQEGVLVRFPHLTVGWAGGPSFTRIPICNKTLLWLYNDVGLKKPPERLLFKKAGLRRLRLKSPTGNRTRSTILHLTTSPGDDDRALVLVQSAAGPGGKVAIDTNSRVHEVAQGDWQGSTEKLVVMEPSGIVRVKRSGELEGAWPEYILGWDGGKMHRLDKHVLR